MESKLLHADVTEKIIGAAFEVYRELGYGFLESVYQNAMQVELQRLGLKVEIESPIKVKYRNVVVGEFRADLFVNESCDCRIEGGEELQRGRRTAVIKRIESHRNQGWFVDQLWSDRS